MAGPVKNYNMLTRQQKEEIVSDLTQAFLAQGSVLMLDYRGVDASSMVDLRHRVREAGGKLRVVKKTLLRRALEAANLPVPDEDVFLGQTGIVYGFDDPVAAAKAIVSFRKKLVKIVGDPSKVTFAVRGGILDGDVLLSTDANALAAIPSREELLQKAVGSIAAPLRNLVGILTGPQRSFVYALHAIAKAKS